MQPSPVTPQIEFWQLEYLLSHKSNAIEAHK